MKRIGVIGAGAWGTALACVAARAGLETALWAREPEVVDSVNRDRENPVFLPGIALDPAIRATGDLADAAASDAILLVAPAQFLRATCGQLAPALAPNTPAVICSKGVEQGTGALMTEAVSDALPGHPIAVLSGPTFAAEVARDLPTAVTLACADKAVAENLIAALGGPRFRPYRADDLIGAEIGGAVKNVLAIACGVTSGRGLGDNARAALITRGLAEMTRLAVAKGGRPETMMGLCGIGDLTLTCTDMQSRNYSLGVALGEGKTLDQIMAERRSVAEGVFSAVSVTALAQKLGIEMPICAAVNAILHHTAPIDTVIEALLSRPFRAEAAEET